MGLKRKKRIMVDMSATLIHHGHIRLLKAASELGLVVVALTTDDEIRKKKGDSPELNFSHRKEILEAIRYVDEVVPCNWMLTDDFLEVHNIDYLVHGDDNSNEIAKEKLILFPRTAGISSELIRDKANHKR